MVTNPRSQVTFWERSMVTYGHSTVVAPCHVAPRRFSPGGWNRIHLVKPMASPASMVTVVTVALNAAPAAPVAGRNGGPRCQL